MPKKESIFLKRIPKSVILTPGGMVALFMACALELLDYLFDLIGYGIFQGLHYEVMTGPLKTFLDFLFAIFSAPLLGVSFLSNLLPFLIERIPLIGTILPTWVLRIFL